MRSYIDTVIEIILHRRYYYACSSLPTGSKSTAVLLHFSSAVALSIDEQKEPTAADCAVFQTAWHGCMHGLLLVAPRTAKPNKVSGAPDTVHE